MIGFCFGDVELWIGLKENLMKMDYFVVGVGVMGMVFIDVFLIEIDVIVIFVDCCG